MLTLVHLHTLTYICGMPKTHTPPEDTHADTFNDVAPIVSTSRAPRTRHVMVTRHGGMPDVTRMIEDAYHVVDQQLGQFRAEASHEKLDIRGATVLHKLVSVLGILEKAEQARISNLQLSHLSKESLDLLAEQAGKFGDNDEP